MIRKLTLRITAFLLIASFTSSASACYLFPFLNPFAWTCGNGCDSPGYGHASLWRSWWNHGCGYGYGGYYGGYRSYGGSIYSPSYNPGFGAPASDCNCNASTGPSVVPSPGAGAAWNAPMRPMHQQMEAPVAWQQPSHGMYQPQQFTSQQFAPPQFTPQQFAPQQTALSTMPVYGPTWEVPQHTPPQFAAPQHAQASGDVYGDHEHRVIQNSYRPADRPLVRHAGYQRPARPYGRFIR